MKQGKAIAQIDTAVASTNLKPFQGLKQGSLHPGQPSLVASTNLKPFQGLKPDGFAQIDYVDRGFNQPKTLSGIETNRPMSERTLSDPRFNQPKTLSGIETAVPTDIGKTVVSFNQPKTLSGIETEVLIAPVPPSVRLQPT